MFHMIGMRCHRKTYSLMTDEANWMIDNIYSAERRGWIAKLALKYC